MNRRCGQPFFERHFIGVGQRSRIAARQPIGGLLFYWISAFREHDLPLRSRPATARRPGCCRRASIAPAIERPSRRVFRWWFPAPASASPPPFETSLARGAATSPRGIWAADGRTPTPDASTPVAQLHGVPA